MAFITKAKEEPANGSAKIFSSFVFILKSIENSPSILYLRFFILSVTLSNLSVGALFEIFYAAKVISR